MKKQGSEARQNHDRGEADGVVFIVWVLQLLTTLPK
jgi:hypothetical protein